MILDLAIIIIAFCGASVEYKKNKEKMGLWVYLSLTAGILYTIKLFIEILLK